MANKIDNIPTLSPCELVKAEISKYSGWNVNTMFAIAQAENRSCNPSVHNLTTSETHRRADGSIICIGSYSVLQVGCLHYSTSDDKNDLATNIRIAYRVWSGRNTWGNGYEAWSMYNNGTYKQFMQ